MPSDDDEYARLIDGAEPAPKRKRGKAGHRKSRSEQAARAVAAVMSGSYIAPSRGGERARKVRVPHLGELIEIRNEMLRLYRQCRQNLGDGLDASDARALASILKAMADIRSVEVGDRLAELEEMIKARLPDHPKRGRGYGA